MLEQQTEEICWDTTGTEGKWKPLLLTSPKEMNGVQPRDGADLTLIKLEEQGIILLEIIHRIQLEKALEDKDVSKAIISHLLTFRVSSDFRKM